MAPGENEFDTPGLEDRLSEDEQKYSIGNTVNSIVITLYGARWILEISGGTFCKVYYHLSIILHT